MHELSIAMALVGQAQEALAGRAVAHVDRITVRIGALSGVDPEALSFAFPVAAAGTPVAGAELRIERVDPEVRCQACGRTTQPKWPGTVCAACGSSETTLAEGREMSLVNIEYEEPAAAPEEPGHVR